MGEVSAIAWTHATFNPWIGCTRVSPGCENCYAETFATGRMKLPVWGLDAPRHLTSDDYWKGPRRWNRAAARAGERRRVFCASFADVFERPPARNIAANETIDGARRKLWPIIEETPWLDWLLLTKRPENVPTLIPWTVASALDAALPRNVKGWPMNVWLGTTAEDQTRYDQRWPSLAATGAPIQFISYEPAIGPLVLKCNGCGHDVGAHLAPDQGGCSGWFPDWVIVGAESGARRRPFEIEWLRRVVDDCRRARIPVFVKQDSAFKSGERGRIPDDLWIHQFPRGAA